MNPTDRAMQDLRDALTKGYNMPAKGKFRIETLFLIHPKSTRRGSHERSMAEPTTATEAATNLFVLRRKELFSTTFDGLLSHIRRYKAIKAGGKS